jgi:hypothetical protein
MLVGDLSKETEARGEREARLESEEEGVALRERGGDMLGVVVGVLFAGEALP